MLSFLNIDIGSSFKAEFAAFIARIFCFLGMSVVVGAVLWSYIDPGYAVFAGFGYFMYAFTGAKAAYSYHRNLATPRTGRLGDYLFRLVVWSMLWPVAITFEEIFGVEFELDHILMIAAYAVAVAIYMSYIYYAMMASYGGPNFGLSVVGWFVFGVSVGLYYGVVDDVASWSVVNVVSILMWPMVVAIETVCLMEWFLGSGIIRTLEGPPLGKTVR